MKGVIIVSGGMDSATLAYYMQDMYKQSTWHHVSFNYGQRHSKELYYAERIAMELNASHTLVDLRQLGDLLAGSQSVLVDHSIEVPEGHYEEETMKATVVPNRNSIMLSIATGVAVAEDAELVAAGMHAGDHFIYPDCRPTYFDAFNHSMRLANRGFWTGRLIAPFIEITKADIVRIGDQLGVDYSNTWSCYKGGEVHCGKCGTCVERREAFELAGVADPTQYEERGALL